MKENILFSEIQRLKQWWIVLLLLIIGGLSLFRLFMQIIYGQQIGEVPTSNTTLLVVSGVILLLLVIFLSFRLETKIGKDGINVRLFPFQFSYKCYKWESIAKAYIREYDPMDFKGWGLRGFGNNKVLSISGNMGLQIEFSNNKKVLIGTNEPEKLKEILNKIEQMKKE